MEQQAKQESKNKGLEKRVQKAKELQEQLKRLGVDNFSLMDSLIYQSLLDLTSRAAWIQGTLGVAIGLLIAITVAVF